MRNVQIALMVAVSLLALGGMRLGTAQPATPNIIFILTDDLNANLIEFMPNLKQQLVAQGTTLKNFFVNVSLCCPSRANILRGQYAHNTQILTNLMPTGALRNFTRWAMKARR
jgi:N-acetylglucosamine-6-sulfatase